MRPGVPAAEVAPDRPWRSRRGKRSGGKRLEGEKAGRGSVEGKGGVEEGRMEWE